MSSKFFVAAILAALVISPVSQAQTAQKDIGRAPNGAYALDPAHSQVLFAIGHLDLTQYHGRFNKLSGSLNLDANAPERSAVTVTIDMDSADTPSNELNNVLKSSSVFATGQYATATFKSTSVTRTGADTGRITGDLTLKGVTKPVTLNAVFNGGKPDPLRNAFALGFSAKTTIKRSDFGLTGMIWSPFVGDEVNLTIEALFEQEKE